MIEKPHAPSTERNREPILDVLRQYFADRKQVLEIGSGTGQHAVYFAQALPQLQWQCSERADQLDGIRAWLHEAALPNTPPPLELDVAHAHWPEQTFDAVFSANTLHIMPWSAVQQLFARLPQVLAADARVVVYGPFNYDGKFTSDSNAQFDVWLKQQEPHRGIRDFEAVDALAQQAGLKLLEDRAMPSNNRCLVWAKA
ncbi:DUF938 domain-containing protein [Sinimarinibacterium sp. CAU 1509]|uniref:DUF938 domain-containing protein n=1 Tax=Sinimarinibacterium sp. CAU 1509 TaxID=2562283 RepID=UPI0010AC6DC5|nr:DUF938 domain-containing protein [Sinimarinibacterium sp. CAU 1509]TJY59321.1 DUF938 domain-containing protein [Sinimarinibacterium sp. CAU 1509]